MLQRFGDSVPEREVKFAPVELQNRLGPTAPSKATPALAQMPLRRARVVTLATIRGLDTLQGRFKGAAVPQDFARSVRQEAEALAAAARGAAPGALGQTIDSGTKAVASGLLLLSARHTRPAAKSSSAPLLGAFGSHQGAPR